MAVTHPVGSCIHQSIADTKSVVSGIVTHLVHVVVRGVVNLVDVPLSLVSRAFLKLIDLRLNRLLLVVYVVPVTGGCCSSTY